MYFLFTALLPYFRDQMAPRGAVLDSADLYAEQLQV